MLSRIFFLKTINIIGIAALILLPIKVNAESISNKLIIFSKFNSSTFGKYDSEERATVIAKEYEQLFSQEIKSKRLRNLSPENLGYLFRATEYVAFYTLKDEYVGNMEAIIDVLTLKKKVNEQQITSLYGAYISVRNFSKANALKSRYPDIDVEAIPRLLDTTSFSSGQRIVWDVNSESESLQKRSINLKTNAHVVIVSHPNCHFSNDAIVAISSDPALMRALSKSSTWLLPQSRRLDFKLVQKWNLEHLNFPLTMVGNKFEWPEINDWATPNFYFYKDGLLVSKFTGWPKEGNKQKLVEGLRLIGLFKDELVEGQTF